MSLWASWGLKVYLVVSVSEALPWFLKFILTEVEMTEAAKKRHLSKSIVQQIKKLNKNSTKHTILAQYDQIYCS